MPTKDQIRAREILAESAWLREHGPDLIEPLLTHGRLTRLRAGQWAHAEGDDDTGVLVVVRGTIQLLCQAPGGREVIIGQAGPGGAMGQAMGFGGGPRLVTVVCAEDSLLLRISDRALARIAVDHPRIWEAVAALLYQQLRGLLQVFADASALSPRQRLAARLEQLARASPDRREIRLSQQTLAEMVGLSRKTVNAYLGELEADGLVRRSYGAISLLDVGRLRRMVGR